MGRGSNGDAFHTVAGPCAQCSMHVWCCCRAEGQNPVPQQLLRKYIAYAQQFVQPVLSGEAKQVLRSFYLELRGMRDAAQDVPVTVSAAVKVRCLVAVA